MKTIKILILILCYLSVFCQKQVDTSLNDSLKKLEDLANKEGIFTSNDKNEGQLIFKNDSINQPKYQITFLGCDETPERIYFGYFNKIFYENLSKGRKGAFEIAKSKLFEKYSNCPILPILNKN